MSQTTASSDGLMVFDHHPVQYRAPLYRHLQQQMGIPVTVIYNTDASIVGGHDKEFGIKVTWDSDLLSGYKSVFLNRSNEDSRKQSWSVFLSLSDQIKLHRPRALLLLGYGESFYRSSILSAIHSGTKLLFRGETTDHALVRNRLKATVRDSLLSRLYDRCSQLLYIGSRSRAHYKRLNCHDSKLTFAPYCVDVAPFRHQETDRDDLRSRVRTALGISQEQKVLLFSGKLSYRKGPDLLLDAVHQLPPAVRETLHVVFMGTGDVSDALKSQAERLNLSDRIRFVGFQNQSSLSPYYHAADLLVLPSRYSETWGLVVNEALHHGLPCVVSDAVGSAPDLVRSSESGEVSRADSAEDLAAAIQRALPITGLPQTRNSCRQIVSSYTLDAAAKGIVSAYASL